MQKGALGGSARRGPLPLLVVERLHTLGVDPDGAGIAVGGRDLLLEHVGFGLLRRVVVPAPWVGIRRELLLPAVGIGDDPLGFSVARHHSQPNWGSVDHGLGLNAARPVGTTVSCQAHDEESAMSNRSQGQD